MSQRNVQLLIGRLVTDEELRLRYLRAPAATLEDLAARGWELTRGEMDALLAADRHLWGWMATRLPSRLKRCPLHASDDTARDRQD